ncbi:MAG TPA: cytidine deaminase [Planctomycetaceae bacterium]|nr:cytidine deaminase [Planctomycetaceae bacterium]
MSLSNQMQAQLIQQAMTVRKRAYAPYSNYPVGAAILGADGEIYLGCNVENASYGLTICAERGAVMAMVTGGCKQISAIAIALSAAGTPCGACRQVLTEFGLDFPVILVDAESGCIQSTWQSSELLPSAFRLLS